MKNKFITKDEENLIITWPSNHITFSNGHIDSVQKIPLYQKQYNCYMESEDNPDGFVGECDNFVGCIEGDKFGFIQVIDLSYKDSFDYGDFIVEFSDYPELITLKEFKKICKDFDIFIYEYPICAYCNKVIFGCYGFGSKGNKCSDCQLKEERESGKEK